MTLTPPTDDNFRADFDRWWNQFEDALSDDGKRAHEMCFSAYREGRADGFKAQYEVTKQVIGRAFQ